MGEKRHVPSSLASLCRPIVLFRAVRSGDHIEVKRLIVELGISVDSRGPLEDTDNVYFEVSALHLACLLRKEEIAAVLIDLGADTESKSDERGTPLFYACHIGLVSIVKKLIEKQCNVNLRNEDCVTALHFGCESGNVDVCSSLLDNGAVIEAADEDKKTPLHWACEWNKLDAVKLLISRGADIEAKDRCERTPFLISCESGNVEIMKYLVENGCDTKAEDKIGVGALHLACAAGETEAMDWLVSNGFNYCDTGKWGRTTLHCACAEGNLEVAMSLVYKHGLHLEQRSEDGLTPFLDAVISGNVKLVKWLHEQRCKMSVRDQRGNTALHLALEHSNEEVFFYLIEHFFEKCNENAGLLSTANETSTQRNVFELESINDTGETVFLVACREGLQKVVQFLCEKMGCNCRAKDKNGKSGLHLSCENGHMRTADYLMKTFGLDPEETDNINETSLMKASKGKFDDVITAQILLKATQRDFSENYKNRSPTLLFACNSMPEAIDKTVFLLACKNGVYEVVKSLLERDCYRLANDKSAMLGLHLSCENGHTSTAEYLIKKLELDFEGIDDMNETPLMKACRGGHAVTAEMLLKAEKWNLHAKNKHGENALHLACNYRHGAKVAHCLISSGLISNKFDYNGRTPLMNACINGLLLIVRLLAESDEGSLDQKNGMGQNLLHLACINGHDDVSQFLIERGAITDERDEMGFTPLEYACRNGLLVAVKYLVKMGHSVSLKCQMMFNSSSLLHWTCDKIGHVQIIQFLVQSGADFDERDNYDETPLMLASRRGFISAVKFFCSIGSSLVATSKDGWSPLHYACRNGHASVANFLIGKYIELDVCLNKPDKINKTPLVYAYENGMLSVVQQLEARGCSLHVDDALLTSACIPGSTATLNRIFKRHTSVVWDVWKYFSKACEKKRVDVAVFLMKLFSKLLVEGGRYALLIACKQNSLCVADHLIKLGCSVNHKTSNGESLLHLACKKGHVGIVHLFLDAGAAANEVDKAGETVLRAACKKNLLSVVARLINSGCLLKEKRKKEETLLHIAGGRDVAQFLVREADFMLNAIDSNGNTPLMAACQREHFKVANCLIENGSSVNQKNEFAESPFSWFLEHCWTSINPLGIFDGLTVERFVSAGADVSSKSKRSKVNVLHVVARKVFQNGEKACRFFLDKGADPDAQDKSGKVPYEYADGNRRKILREAWAKRRYSKLEELGESKPSKIKVCLIGKVGAGKTTLMNSLRRMQSEEVQSSDPKRTAGIDIITAAIDEAGDVVFCDFAGQPNFHKTHSLFFSESTTIYLLVVDVTNSKQEIYLSSLYWLSLTKCSIGSSTNNSIVLIGSRGDKTTDGSMILRQLRTSLASKFEKFFDVFSESFILDCRVSTSVEMQKLRGVISDLKAKRIEEAPCTFTLVDDLQFILLPVLRDISKKLRPLEALEELNLLSKFMRVRKRESNTSCLEIIDDKNERLNDFPSFGKQIKAVHCRQFVSRDFFCLLIDANFFTGLDKDTLYQFVHFLHGIGEIIEFGDNIILDPPWLCNNVIGPLMSPETFPVCLEGVDDGTVSSKRIEKAICQFNKQQRDFPLEVIMELLCSLEICYVVPSEENVYRFPALILKRRRDEFWIEDEDVIVYVGRRLQCKDETDIIVPGTIPFLQTRSVVCLDPSPQIWKDGMVLEKRIDEMTTIEGLIELQETAKAIDVVARGPASSEAECLDFVKEMLDMVRKVLDDRSPGTIIDCELYLSTSALKKLVEHPPAHKPSLIEIAKSKDSPVSTTRKMERYTDTLRDLLIVPSDHYCLLSRKVKVGLQEALNFCKQSLCLLGKELGLKASEVIGCKDSERLLRIWNSRPDALVSKLVHCLRKCRLLVALYIMHRDTIDNGDTPFVQLSDDEAAAAEKAFESTFCVAMDDSKSLPLEGDREVEESHIDYLKEEVIDSDGVLHDFIRHLLGWSFTRAKQFLNNSKDQTIAMKFFDAVMQWRDREGLNATIGKLLEAFEKVGKKGAAVKLLSRLN